MAGSSVSEASGVAGDGDLEQAVVEEDDMKRERGRCGRSGLEVWETLARQNAQSQSERRPMSALRLLNPVWSVQRRRQLGSHCLLISCSYLQNP